MGLWVSRGGSLICCRAVDGFGGVWGCGGEVGMDTVADGDKMKSSM
mgnify:CR=1 FL=1